MWSSCPSSYAQGIITRASPLFTAYSHVIICYLVVNRVCFWLRSLRHTNCWTNALPSDIKSIQKTKQLMKNFILKWHNLVNPNTLPLLPVSQQDEEQLLKNCKNNTDLFTCWQSLGVNVCYVQYSREFLEGSF